MVQPLKPFNPAQEPYSGDNKDKNEIKTSFNNLHAILTHRGSNRSHFTMHVRHDVYQCIAATAARPDEFVAVHNSSSANFRSSFLLAVACDAPETAAASAVDAAIIQAPLTTIPPNFIV